MPLKSLDRPEHSDPASRAALDESLDATLSRWQSEAAHVARRGVYDWLTGRIAGRRVLEIGCGFGVSTAALVRGAKTVFALDNRMDCLEASQQLVPAATFGLADVHHYAPALLEDLRHFAPDAVVCWMAGAPADALPRDVPAVYAVMQHRLVLQQAVVSLASLIDSVQTVHLADRTAFPWKMKDAGRQTMAKMIGAAVLSDAPFAISVTDVQFRKIDDVAVAGSGLVQGAIPVIGEATLRRRHNVL